MGKVKTLAIDLDVELFIRNIQKRPVIWDRHIHVQKQVVYQMWKDLSRIHGLSSETLKAKWKGLRDNFRVEYKRIPRNANDELTIDPADFDSKWTFYKNLLFLADHMRSRHPKNIHSIITELANELIQIPDDTNTNNAADYETMEDDDSNGSDYDEDIQKVDEIDEKYVPINLTRRSIDISTPPSANVGQPILILDEFLRSKALPAKKRKLPVPDDTPLSRHQLVITAVPKPSGEDSHYQQQQPVSTSTPLNGVGSSRLDNTPANSVNFLNGIVENASVGNSALSAASATPIDDDYHFLMSLYPYMAKLSDTQKLRLRMKIQGLVYQELYSED